LAPNRPKSEKFLKNRLKTVDHRHFRPDFGIFEAAMGFCA